MRIVGSLSAWQNLKELEEQVIADQFSKALGEDASPRDVQELSAQKSDKQSAYPGADSPGVLLEDTRPRIIEGVELALKFSLTPEQTQKICGDIVGQKERVKECTKFVQNWLMHSSVAELTAYLGKPA